MNGNYVKSEQEYKERADCMSGGETGMELDL